MPERLISSIHSPRMLWHLLLLRMLLLEMLGKMGRSYPPRYTELSYELHQVRSSRRACGGAKTQDLAEPVPLV